MASSGRAIRRGLPRIPGGEPWPPAGAAAPAAIEAVPVATPPVPVATPPVVDVEPVVGAGLPASAAPGPAAAAQGSGTLRRGLPRVAGGEPWPPGGETVPAGESATATVADAAAAAEPGGRSLRRGLPRIGGGEPWPPAGSAHGSAPGPAPLEVAAPTVPEAPRAEVLENAAPQGEPEPAIPEIAEPPAVLRPAVTVTADAAAVGAHPLRWWVTRGVLGIVGLVIVAAVIVLAARGVTTLPGVPDFLATYSGEYPLPAFVDPGFPAWANWTHFLNFFFLVMIVQSGLRVRHQRKPPAFHTPKRGGKKVSINLWLHTSLDVLWFVNGVVFVVLLFVSGHWARIVPTSWEVFPNALSALLQYLTLEWPHENGWVNYNSLQQLSYFVVVFIAAPLAVISGIRMSQWWPKNAPTLDKIYPAALARAVHYPTMLFFVLFVVVHVFLVFTTGALNNLNHMFAGSNDVSWAGFWWFAGGLVVTVGAAFATRPLLLAPIAGVSGKVSNR